jgi:hypothetical protein
LLATAIVAPLHSFAIFIAFLAYLEKQIKQIKIKIKIGSNPAGVA